MPQRGRSFEHGLLAVVAVSAMLVLPVSDLRGQEESRWTGMSVDAALQELRAMGLRIVFSDNVVLPEMTVEREPGDDEPMKILADILAPHGLVAREGPNETIVVVRRVRGSADGAFARGTVSASVDATPIAGARVLVVGSAEEVMSDALGRFSIDAAVSETRLSVEVRARGFLPARLESVTRGSVLTVLLNPLPTFEEQVVVSPSRVSLLREVPAAPIGLSRDEIANLPQLGGDFYRALTLLPGATSNDVSAQFHVRGGRRDETQILLDGQELYDAFHLKDRDSAVSFIAPETIGGADLNTGGFPAEYGDRMSGVLDMTTVKPSGSPRFSAGLGLLSANVGGAGQIGADRGGWMVEARRGATDLVGRLLGDEDPLFWDVFAKVDYDLNPGNALRLNVLASGDELDFEEVVEGERKLFRTDYGSSYAWLTHQGILSSRMVFKTAVSVARIDRDRRGFELEEGAQFAISDERETEVLGLRQSWDLMMENDRSLTFGWQLRQFETEYRYLGTRDFDNPLARIRHDYNRPPLTSLEDEFEDRMTGLYAAQRLRPFEGTTVELGLRWDRHSLIDEEYFSPRFNVARGIGERSVVRVAWGRYNQSQRTYELEIEDGDQSFQPVERSEHRVLGFETLVGRGTPGKDLAVRIELYQRRVGNPRPRYENLYEPLNTFPEVEPDRVLIEPEKSLAEGIELFVRGGFGRRLDWWVNYTLSSTEDRVDGRWAPRLFDQTHALNLDVDYRISSKWRLNAAWRYHTGWPTTPLSLRQTLDDEGEVIWVPLLGPLNSDRVSDYHRLDVRLSRDWGLSWGAARLFLDIQNAYDRKNVAGFDMEIDEEEGVLVPVSEAWVGVLPSAGIRIEF